MDVGLMDVRFMFRHSEDLVYVYMAGVARIWGSKLCGSSRLSRRQQDDHEQAYKAKPNQPWIPRR